MWNNKKSRLETERTELIEFFKKNLNFLVQDFGYSHSLEKEFDEYPGGAKYYFLRFKNYQLQRQIEIILHRNSDYRLWTVKKINGSEIPDYYDNENTIDITDLDLLSFPETFDYMKHAVFSEKEKRTYVLEMIKFIKEKWLGIIDGTQWIDRKEIDKISLKKWKSNSGFNRDELLEKIKTEFKFLENYGYKLTKDTNKLPPFEQSVACEIVYTNVKENDSYSIYNDYRDYGFRIDYSKTDKEENQMINHVLTENQDKEWDFVDRMAYWLENRIKHTVANKV